MKSFFKAVLPYVITSALGIAMFFSIISAGGIWHENNELNVISLLMDGAFVPGALFTCIGLLIFASNGGAFDMLAFAVIRFFDLFRKDVKGKYKDFYEYHTVQKDKKRPLAFMLIVGLVFLTFAIILLIVFLSMT